MDDTGKEVETRLALLSGVIKETAPESIIPGNISPIRIETKSFFSNSSSQSIFQG